jgi:16S rRNA processing protein RimM
MTDSHRVVMGRLAGVYGVKGWLKVHSYTEPRENLLGYKAFEIERNGQWQPLIIDEGRSHGRGLIVHLRGIDDRDIAAEYVGANIAVPASAMPALPKGEYYWHQLEGLKVFTVDHKILLGRVDHLLETGANDVLVIHACEGSLDQQERLVPYVKQYVLEVNLEAGEILVDWDPDF